MKNKNYFLLIVVLALGTLVGYLFRPSAPSPMESNNTVGRGPNYAGTYGEQARVEPSRNNCLSDDCLLVEDLEYPVGDLPDSVVEALDMAIEDEYKALSTYLAVIEEFGTVRPFSMIKGAEEGHIASLKAIYDKYGIQAPENELIGTITPPATLVDSCALGIQAEIDNAALYRDELIPMVSDYEDITLVFDNLMSASESKHLPAFERCAR